jgi:hypothetical protein
MKSINRALGLICLLLSRHALALPQTANTGALNGVVTDSTGAVVVNAPAGAVCRIV